MNEVLKQEKRILICYFDGACYPKNPNGDMGVGAIIFDTLGVGIKRNQNGSPYQQPHPEWKVLFTYNKFYPFKSSGFNTTTNNIAEYLAFTQICLFLKEVSVDTQIYILGDSNLVVRQMCNDWKIGGGKCREYAIKAKELYNGLPQRSKNLVWIPRELNQVADDLSKKQ